MLQPAAMRANVWVRVRIPGWRSAWRHGRRRTPVALGGKASHVPPMVRRFSSRVSVVVTLAIAASAAVWVTGCNVPTPLAPAEPIGNFPNWGTDFATPTEQPRSLMGAGLGGAPMDGQASSTGAAMPGAIKNFSGGDAVAGKGIYITLCQRCHGAAGEGGALPGGIAVPALADAGLQDRLTDAKMARSIALGQGAMPSFMNDLDRDKLAAVIAYIRTLKKG